MAPDSAHDLEADPHLLAGVVRAILDANFPATLHGDILAAVGLDLEADELAPVATTGQSARRRDPTFRERVLTAYEYQCAVCGYDGQLLREAVGLEAAHIRWWAADGPDEVDNAVALCSLHHKLLDGEPSVSRLTTPSPYQAASSGAASPPNHWSSPW